MGPAPLAYLHGFASGPGSGKCARCRDWAQGRGIPFHAPDLNLPDFEHLKCGQVVLEPLHVTDTQSRVANAEEVFTQNDGRNS